MKTYIQYGSGIKSKDLVEAISIPSGMGPISGFGSIDPLAFTADSPTTVEVRSLPFNSGEVYINNTVDTKNLHHGVTILDTNYDATKLISESVEANRVTFSCITKDGYEYADTKDTITVPIVNSSRGNFNELLVYAYHDFINVGIENPVYFKAFWNRGGTSFYDYYRNMYLDSALSDFNGYVPKRTYKELIQAANSSRGIGVDDNGTLIGIYGVDPSDSTKYFSIIPYEGNIQPMTFDKSILDYMDAYLAKMKQFMGEYPASSATIKDYIDQAMTPTGESEEPVGYIPIGGIIIWSKSTVPDGFSICDGTNGTPDLRGRFVYGSGGTDAYGNALPIGATGGEKGVKLTMNNIPSHTHDIWVQDQKWGDTANWRPFANNDVNSSSAPWNNLHTQPAGKANPDPISTLPPFMVLYYIMRIR